MKRIRKWHRICILSFLCFSTFAPAILVSYILLNPACEGPNDFVADLSSIKHKADILKLNAVNEKQHADAKHDLDEKVKEMKDQQIIATAYLSLARTKGNIQFAKKLKLRIKEINRVLIGMKKDYKLSQSAFLRMRNMRATLLKASTMYPDCSELAKKLQAMTHDAGRQIQLQRKKTIRLRQFSGRTTSRSLHCLSMRLTTEFFAQPLEKREPVDQLKFYNRDLLHFAVFSDNVLASAVVFNSTVSTAKEPEKVIFHVVTDSLNFHGMSMWFLSNPPGKATIQVHNSDNVKSLLAKYEPIRFILPELFPHLDKIVVLEHDVVVLKDLSVLWSLDMKGKVNGVVNSRTFFGMNLFDLKEWRKQDLSSKYHKYLVMGSKKSLWSTFYNHAFRLDGSWLVTGLGHDAGVSQESIQQAAVIQYNGIMKPWLDIRINRYKDYWTKYINFDHPYLQECNIG